MYQIEFVVDKLSTLPNARSQRSFWVLHQEKRIWARLIFGITAGKKPDAPLKKAHVIITRCSSRECDLDNLYASLKAPLDALVKIGFIKDDKPSCCTLEAKWEKVKIKECKMKFFIKEIEG